MSNLFTLIIDLTYGCKCCAFHSEGSCLLFRVALSKEVADRIAFPNPEYVPCLDCKEVRRKLPQQHEFPPSSTRG